MLSEIEDRLVKILRDYVAEVPRENIVINVKPAKLPAVVVSNLKFKFKNAGLAEDLDEGKAEVEERLSGDGVKTTFKLQEKPLKDSVRVESPPGALLTDKDDYRVNYDEGSIDFRVAPSKEKKNVFVRYSPPRSVMRLKSVKVKALYSIDVWGADRVEADSLAEKVVKTLLAVEDELLAEGIESRPVEGMVSVEEKDKAGRVRLKYVFEKELRVEKLVEPIEKIEITSKNL